MTADTDVAPPEWAMRLLMTHDHLGEPYCACCGEPVSKEHDEGCEVGKVVPLVDSLVRAARRWAEFNASDGDRHCIECAGIGDPDPRKPMQHENVCTLGHALAPFNGGAA